MLGAAMKMMTSCLLGLWLFVMTAVSWAAGGVPDPGQKGPYAVGFATDTIYNGPFRPIPVYVWYPADPADVVGAERASYPMAPLTGEVQAKSSEDFEEYGLDAAYDAPTVSSKKPFPLVIFSPGASGAAWHHVSTATRLASHGFVVAVLYHYGDGFWPGEQSFRLEAAAWFRPRDISFALDMLLLANDWPDHLLGGAIRPDQVAAAGYSLGGYAAMVLGGAGEDNVCKPMEGWYKDPPPPKFCSPTGPDDRIKAVVAFSPASFLLDWAELAQIRVPTIILNEEWDLLAATSWIGPDEHARAHAAIQGKPSYRADIFGTNHNSFCDTCEFLSLMHDDPDIQNLMPVDDDDIEFVCVGDQWTSTPSTVAMPIVNKYAVAFLKTVLAREQGYQDMLTPAWALKREPLVEFFVTEKRNPNAVKDDPGFGAYYLYFPHQPGSEQALGKKDPSVKPILQRGFTPR
jgi:predicted dienelactone hydrolase